MNYINKIEMCWKQQNGLKVGLKEVLKENNDKLDVTKIKNFRSGKILLERKCQVQKGEISTCDEIA